MGAGQQALMAVPIPGGDFDPTTIAGCTMWISGDDPLLSGLSPNDPIGGATLWTDRVTGTRTWAQASAALRPTYQTGGANGKPYINFASDRLDYSVAASNIWTAGAFTIFAVVRPQSAGNASMTEAGKNIISPGGYVGVCLLSSAGNNKFAFYRYNGGYVGVISTTTYSLNTWYIVECWYDGTNLSIKVNNDTAVVQAASNPQQLTDFPAMSYSTSIDSDLTELDTWNVSVSSGNRDIIRNGLAAKYAITL